MSWDAAILTVTVLATAVWIVFSIYYGGGFRWERSAAGRSIFTEAAAIVLLGLSAIAVRVHRMADGASWRAVSSLALLIAWLVLAGVGFYRLRELRQSTSTVYHPRKRGD